MKKLFVLLAVAAIMVSCGNKKKSDKPADGKDTATTSTTTNTGDQTATTTTTTTTTSTMAGIPTFSDPDVQKFVNEYSAFITEYKAGITDPAKAMELAKTAQVWAGKMGTFGMKLASNPEDMKKWTEWATWISKEMTPVVK